MLDFLFKESKFSLSVYFIYPMSGRYSSNWDRKGWPGSEIQMYYGCPRFSNKNLKNWFGKYQAKLFGELDTADRFYW